MEDIIYTVDAIKDMDLGIQRKGLMNTAKYQEELRPRTETTPLDVDTKSKILQIAKGTGIRVFNNPQQLATSLCGFERFCLDKNIVPSFVAIATYLNVSKSTVLKYMKDQEQYSIYIIHDSLEDIDIYSTANKKCLDIYISKNNIVEVDKDTGNNITYSIQSKLDSGEYGIINKSVSFADVMEPVNNLVELITTNKAYTMRNPAWAIWCSKNHFGATTDYVDRQEYSIQATNSLDELSDEQVLKAAQSRPDDT